MGILRCEKFEEALARYSASISWLAAVVSVERSAAAPAERWPFVCARSISPATARIAFRTFATRRAGGGECFASRRTVLRAAAARRATRFNRRRAPGLVACLGSTPAVTAAR